MILIQLNVDRLLTTLKHVCTKAKQPFSTQLEANTH